MADVQAKLQALSEEFTKLQQGVSLPKLSQWLTVSHACCRSSRNCPVEAEAGGSKTGESRSAGGLLMTPRTQWLGAMAETSDRSLRS